MSNVVDTIKKIAIALVVIKPGSSEMQMMYVVSEEVKSVK